MMLTAQQAKAALIMFESRQFDTADIAELLGLRESDVARLLHASRDVTRDLYGRMTTAANAR